MEFNHSEVIMLLLTAIGPLKVTIVCAALTADASPEFVKRVAFRSVLIALIVCIVFAVLGEAILRLLKVSIPAFQIGGGIIVLLFSLDMVMGSKQESKDGAGSPEEKNAQPSLDIAVYPLAIPLMASVSGLVAIVSLLAQRDDLGALLFLAAVIVAIMAINYVCLLYCRYIVPHGGPGCPPGRRQAHGRHPDRTGRRAHAHGIDRPGAHRETGRNSVAPNHQARQKHPTPRVSQAEGS